MDAGSRTPTTSFSIASMVRGYHIYKDIWDALIGEELSCEREGANYADPFAVAIIKDDNVVGHVPRKISTVCSLFLRRGGSILCRVTGSRRFSRDLPQGGVEIPCMLVFQGDSKYVDKARKLLLTTEAPTDDRSRVQASDISKSAVSVEPATAQVPSNDRVQVSDISKSAGSVQPTTAEVSTNDRARVQVTDISKSANNVEPTTAEAPTRVEASKSAATVKPTTTANAKAVEVKSVIKLDSCNQIDAETRTVWLKKGSIALYDEHKQMILGDFKLNDLVINAAQMMLKEQFPELMGLQSTLLLKKPQPRFQGNKPYVQIIFDREDHWIVASTLFAKSGQVKLYDSVFTTIDKGTKAVISNLYGPEILPRLVNISKQEGGTDCGLFAIAIATTLALRLDPAEITYQQSSLRCHLVKCLEDGKFTMFSIV